MQTRDNAKNFVFNVSRFGNQVSERYSTETLCRRVVKKLSKIKTKEQMEEEAEVVVVHKTKVINRRQKGKQILRGEANQKSNKGCLQQSLNNLAYS